MGIDHKEEENLTVRKVYLYGTQTKKWAYLREYAYNGAFKEHYLEKSFFEATLAFYGAIFHDRAVIKERGVNLPSLKIKSEYPSLKEAHRAFTEEKIGFVFLHEYAMFLSSLRIVKREEVFFVG